MKEVSIRCWNCGQPSMIPDDTIGRGWLSCTRCGATHLPNPTTLGEATLVVDKEESSTYTTVYRLRKRRLPKTSAKAVEG